MILLFPVSFFFYVRSRKNAGETVNWTVVLFGLFTGALVSGFKAFFMFSSPYNGSCFLWYALDVWLSFGFPLIAFMIFFYLFSSDDTQTRFNSYLSFVIPFFTVYFIYETLAMDKPYPFFILFVRPVLYLCMILGIRKSLEILYRYVKQSSKKTLRDACLIVAETFIPALIESVWYYKISLILLTVLVLAYAAVSLVRTVNIRQIKDEFLSSVQQVL